MMTESLIVKPKICLLLTASIDPKGITLLKRKDPLIREQDYISVLKQLTQFIDYPIVFCENSGYSLENIKKVLNKDTYECFEILQYNGQSFPRELGKGYGELQIIKYALDNSSLLRSSDYIVKISGRYFPKNLQALFKGITYEKKAFVMADLYSNLEWGESSIFFCSPSFIHEYLLRFQNAINDSKDFYLEHALAKAILLAISDGHKWFPLNQEPFLMGYGGTHDNHYNDKWFRWAYKNACHRLKDYLNRLSPWERIFRIY